MSEKIFIIGAGGHAKVVFDIAIKAGFEVVAFVDDAPAKVGTLCRGVPVHSGDDAISALMAQGVSNALIAIGSNTIRTKVALRLESLGVAFVVAAHPAAVIDPSVKIGAGTVVMAGAVINADAIIGRHGIINTAASIDHDCRVGDFVHVAPGAHVCGNVEIGNAVLVGALDNNQHSMKNQQIAKIRVVILVQLSVPIECGRKDYEKRTNNYAGGHPSPTAT